MTAYTKTTNFTAKDSLISGNPAKVVKGSEIDAEFDNIATAVNSKSNTASPTFTGTVTIPTLTLGATTLTATGTELNYTDGVTSSIQTQLDAKAPLNSPTLVTPNLGTPSAGTLTNCTGLPVSTGISGLGTGVATFLATPSSANLRSAVTDETGTGSLVFATSPTLVTPALGTPASATLTNATGLPIDAGTTGTLPVTRGGTNLTAIGSANQVLAVNSGGTALEYRTLAGTGTVTSIDVSGGTTGLTTSGGPVTASGTITLSGTLAVANGGTGITSFGTGVATWLGTPSSANLASAITDETGSGALVFGTNPTLTGATLAGALAGADNTVSRVNLLDYGEVTNAIGSVGGGTQDIDLTLGNCITATVDTSTTTFTFSNPTASDDMCGFVLILTNGGSQTVNWPASVDWPSATAPTLTASGVDILVFMTVDGGTTWLGNLVGAAYA